MLVVGIDTFTYTGICLPCQISAISLTWSYADILHAITERENAQKAVQKAESVISNSA